MKTRGGRPRWWHSAAGAYTGLPRESLYCLGFAPMGRECGLAFGVWFEPRDRFLAPGPGDRARAATRDRGVAYPHQGGHPPRYRAMLETCG